MSWSDSVEFVYEAESLRLMLLVWRQVRAITDLAQYAPDNFAPAPILARAAFEGGLSCNWLLNGENANTCMGRWLTLQAESVRRMQRVSGQLGDAGISGERWYQGARRIEAVITKISARVTVEEPAHKPNVLEMLQSLGLERLYIGYILASQWSHGTLLAGGEHSAEQSVPFSLGEWYLPLNMSIWGILFGARGFLQRPGGPGLDELKGTPVGDAQASLEALHSTWAEESPY